MTATSAPLKVEYVPADALNPYAGNPRTHDAKQLRLIAKSIKAHGWLVPILVGPGQVVIAGHGRLLAAKQLGLAQVPVIRADHLSDAQVRAYRIADNKIAEGAGWDNDLLRIELSDLIAIDYDVELTGFSGTEIDNLTLDPDGEDEPPIPPLPASAAVVTELGNVWAVGKHRIICGDSRDSQVMSTLMGKETAAMVFSDPPYNVKIQGHVSGLGKHQHSEFAMASGEMSSAEFTSFLVDSIGAMAAVCRDGALLDLCIDWKHLPELQAACAALKLSPINLCVWTKTNGGMGSLYRSQHELVLIVKKGSAAHINNVELGKHGRYRTNVWSYAGMNSFSAERDEALALHPTVKPIALVRDAILDVTNRGDLVLDGFLGSGTTLLAAQRCGRRCYGIELSPGYVDACLQRWIKETGEQPIHVASGMTYAERLSENHPEVSHSLQES